MRLNSVLKKRHWPDEGVEGHYRKGKHNGLREEGVSAGQRIDTVHVYCYGCRGSGKVPRARLDSTHQKQVRAMS